jgi:hypothetical protein
MKHKKCGGEFAINKIDEFAHANYQERLCTKCHARIYITDSEAAAIMDIEELNVVLGKLERLREEERLEDTGSKKLVAYRRIRELRVNIIASDDNYEPSGHTNLDSYGNRFPAD